MSAKLVRSFQFIPLLFLPPIPLYPYQPSFPLTCAAIPLTLYLVLSTNFSFFSSSFSPSCKRVYDIKRDGHVHRYVFLCDGGNEGCCQLHSRVVLALGKAQHALLLVCVCVCGCVFFFCAKPSDIELSKYHYWTAMWACCFPLWLPVFNPQFDKWLKSFTQHDDWTTANISLHHSHIFSSASV